MRERMREGEDEGVRMRVGGKKGEREERGRREGGEREERGKKRREGEEYTVPELKAATFPVQSYYVHCST